MSDTNQLQLKVIEKKAQEYVGEQILLKELAIYYLYTILCITEHHLIFEMSWYMDENRLKKVD